MHIAWYDMTDRARERKKRGCRSGAQRRDRSRARCCRCRSPRACTPRRRAAARRRGGGGGRRGGRKHERRREGGREGGEGRGRGKRGRVQPLHCERRRAGAGKRRRRRRRGRDNTEETRRNARKHCRIRGDFRVTRFYPSKRGKREGGGALGRHIKGTLNKAMRSNAQRGPRVTDGLYGTRTPSPERARVWRTRPRRVGSSRVVVLRMPEVHVGRAHKA